MKRIFLAATALALALPAVSAPASVADREGEALSALINRELRSGGSWFTPAEQALIVRKCGYRPGEWDGFEANLMNGRFHCTNGRVVDDAEMRGLIEAAEPRIEARVERVMARADVKAAISRVADAAAAEAMREVEARHGR
jgi:hypothetical protein